MDTEHFRRKLLAKQQKLTAEITRLREDAADARESEVQDRVDEAASDEGQSGALEAGTVETHVLEEVRDALLRLDRGEYGRCIDCGREIELERLEAVPWTRHCIECQEKLEQGLLESAPR